MNKHKLADSIARSIAALVSLVATHYAAATTYYVDPVGGLDTNPGTIAAPVKTITKGGVLAGPGDTVNLRGGIYNNPAVLGRNCVFDNTYSGTSGNVIIVQSYPGELAIFDPGYPEFMSNPNTAWVPCTEPGALSDEYISANTYNMAGNDGAWGCFLNANKTAGDRLLTYTNVEDLRATNESFVLVSVSDPRPGRPVWTDTTKKYLWTYRGPGVWWDPATQKIHFRAAPTHFNQPGIADYSGGSDPRSMSLSISLKGHEALNVYQADYLVLKNLVFQNGGNRTAEIGGSSTSNYAEHVTFDHCGFYSSRNGTTTTLTRFLRFQHCVFDGCLPSYVCRSDVKDSFDYVKPDGTKGSDGCSRMTQAALLCAGQNEDKEIANCEFRNGHDGIQLNGETRPRLHDSLIENCNDEAIMFYGAYPCVDIRIYNNVIRSCMQAFSSSVGAVVPPMPSGARYIYRNIIDMRVPSLGYRQLSPDPVLLWRFGEDFKYNDLIPEIYCYQNTFVLADMDGNDCVTFWTNVLDTAQAPRKLMNNIMMILQTDKPIYSIPKVYSGNPHLSDGNLWCRRKAVLDSVLFSSFYTGTSYDTWSDFRNSALWTSYNSANSVGWETHPLNPPTPIAYAQFANVHDYVQGYGHSWPNSDYRLTSTSPARSTGADLTGTGWPDSLSAGSTPDVGALPFGASPLAVGVDGRITFPDSTTPVAEAGDYSIISDTNHAGYVSVNFDSSGSSSPSGPITSYNWVYNGQSISTAASFSQDLPIGNHQVYLTVTNASGSATDMRDISITDPSLYDSIARNAGFEDGGSYWTLGSGCSIVSSPAHFGGGALQASGSVSAASTEQLIAVFPGASVKVSGRIQTNSVPAGCAANVQLTWLDSGGVPVGGTTNVGNVTGTTPWAYYTSTVSAPSTARTAKLKLILGANATGGSAVFDDVRLLQVDNKAINASFERDEADFQTDHWVVTRGTPAIIADPSLSHSGNRALQLVGITDYHMLSQAIPVNAGQTYSIEGWMKTVSMPAGKLAHITVQWLDSTGHYAGVAWAPTQGGTADYTKVATNLTVPSGKAYINVVLSIDGGSTGGTAYFDDIYVK